MSIVSEALHFGYGRQAVLRGVDLRLESGEFLGLLGPNGSGKSTFLKNLLGFLQASQGRLVYWDSTSQPDCLELARRLAFVPQHTGLRGRVSVREAVMMGRLPHLKDRWAGFSEADYHLVDSTLCSLGISRFAERDLACLSGGELQKVVIARCLVQESDILLLDEATSGLDLNHAVEIMELMRQNVDTQGKTVVAVLHDLNLAAQYCDRIALLKDGKVRYLGLPSEVLKADVIEEIYGIRAEVGTDACGLPFVLPKRCSVAEGLAYVS
jgi:iron complex transport system ATP-binding protein